MQAKVSFLRLLTGAGADWCCWPIRISGLCRRSSKKNEWIWRVRVFAAFQLFCYLPLTSSISLFIHVSFWSNVQLIYSSCDTLYWCRVNPPAIITSTTIEVVVPRSVVPAIYGEDGGCLRQIREVHYWNLSSPVWFLLSWSDAIAA